MTAPFRAGRRSKTKDVPFIEEPIRYLADKVADPVALQVFRTDDLSRLPDSFPPLFALGSG